MLLFLNLLFFIKVSVAEPFFEEGEKNRVNFLLWPQTQVFIFESHDFYVGEMPDCFGTLLSYKHVLTAASCLVSSDNEKQFIVKDLKNFIVAKVRFNLV